MRGGVVFACAAVVPIAVRIPRRDGALEPIENVLPQPGLVVVHEHRGRDVHRRDEHHSLCDRRRRATALHVVGDVDDVVPLFRVDREVVGGGGRGAGGAAGARGGGG